VTPPPRTPTPTTAAPRGGERTERTPVRSHPATNGSTTRKLAQGVAQGWLHPILARTRAGKGKEVNARATPEPPPTEHNSTTTNNATDPRQRRPAAVPRSLRVRVDEGPARVGRCNVPQSGAAVALSMAGHGFARCVSAAPAPRAPAPRAAALDAGRGLGRRLRLRLVRSLALGPRSSPPRRSAGVAVALVLLAGRGLDRGVVGALMLAPDAQAWPSRSRELQAWPASRPSSVGLLGVSHDDDPRSRVARLGAADCPPASLTPRSLVRPDVTTWRAS
jgi:hypothetical protein